MSITRQDIEKALDNFDADARAWFLSMEAEERQVVLLSMSASNSNRLAIVEKEQIDNRKWRIDFERDVRRYREQRERRENHDDEEVMGTTQKILKAIADAEAKKFNYGVWFRDRVLPQVITLITLAILYLTFGGKIP